MKKAIKVIYNIFRSVAVTLIIATITFFASIYVALSVPSVQKAVKERGEKELSSLLGTNVTIGYINFKPFNQLMLEDVAIPDREGNHMVTIYKLGAGISIYNLLANQRLVFTFAEIIGLDGRISKATPDSPLNIQFVIDAFKPKEKKEPGKYDVTLYNIVIRQSRLSFDILDQPLTENRFNKNHISLSDIKADLALPVIRNDHYYGELKRLSFREKSGFTLKNLAADVKVTDTEIDVNDLSISLPNSYISPEDFKISFSSLKSISKELNEINFDLSFSDNRITPADLQCFVPALAQLTKPIDFSLQASGTIGDMHIAQFIAASDNNALSLKTHAHLTRITAADRAIDIPSIKFSATGNFIASAISALPSLSPQAKSIITACGNLGYEGKASLRGNDAALNGLLTSSLGEIVLDGSFKNAHGKKQISAQVDTKSFHIGSLVKSPKANLGEVAINADLELTLNGKLTAGSLSADVPFVDFNGYRYHDISINASSNGNAYDATLVVNDPNLNISVNGNAILNREQSEFSLSSDLQNLNLYALNLAKKYPGHSFSGKVEANLHGNDINNISGDVAITDFSFGDDQKSIYLSNISLLAQSDDSVRTISLTSDVLNGSVWGDFNLKTLVPSFKRIIAAAIPSILANNETHDISAQNDLNFKFAYQPSKQIEDFFKIPIRIADRISINGGINEARNEFFLNASAPYLIQGKKIIEGTNISASLDSTDKNLNILVNTIYPLKSGKVAARLFVNGVNDRVDAIINWKMNREHDFSGKLSLSSLLSRNINNKIDADIDINPTTIVFNDTAWLVQKGHIAINDGNISVSNIHGSCDNQFVHIQGEASRDPDDRLQVTLNDMSLDYIFETLDIDNVMFGGRATGNFYCSDLFSGSPRLSTPELHVKNIAYNHAVMGDANIESHWEHDAKAVAINADIAQANGEHTFINGKIFTGCDSLYLAFNASKANLEFMKPFMAAFTSDVSGKVSGKAVLYGNFHDINMYGDIYGEDLKFKLDYTNVYYTCSDSVHMKPGLITFDKVVVHDREGNTALLGGWLRHNCFHDPVFHFAITDANNLLCYDVPESVSDRWYGTIYGNGAAFVSGEPGVVKVNVNMESAPKSKFTFVLSGASKAAEYKFITYRDRDILNAPPKTEQADTIPEIVRKLTQSVANKNNSAPSNYIIDLQMDINPNVQMFVIMDPIGGDRIKGTGNGHIRLAYDNSNEELNMYGRYVMEKGGYNFTLQDIIIKEFAINEGSSISFNGNPFAAQLDIEAIYALNANIRDLDESFASDPDINRTSVPVHAILKARGAIDQPEIDFDLQFPTLSTEAYHKIKSIISTDDMLNQQIIYLLALNRFYTPEYMNGTSNNNELSSVASSTISSQLTNILGKISENWTIAPNFRSEKGDFSDIDVDVALSSQLLNNRLLLNGNFGYRDNAYNSKSSTFIGDFDIQYLLNKKGTIRLKAYNHFNDQNYFVRNAMTTQGVGIVFKHDFDRPFDFLKKTPKTSVSDSTKTAEPIAK